MRGSGARPSRRAVGPGRGRWRPRGARPIVQNQKPQTFGGRLRSYQNLFFREDSFHSAGCLLKAERAGDQFFGERRA